MSHTLVGVRTHRWDEPARMLCGELREAGAEVVVVFHGDPAAAGVTLPCVALDEAWVRRNGLRVLDDWGWRCGDYFYYAFRQSFPAADRYWLIEPDVRNTLGWKGFFEIASRAEADALGYRPGLPSGDEPWARGLRGVAPYTAIFPLTRLSGRAIDYLYDKRRWYSSRPRVSDDRFTNDEMFTFSYLSGNADFLIGDLAELAPRFFEGTHFRSNPDIIEDVVLTLAPGIYHPVRARESFCHETGRRVVNTMRFRKMIEPSLAGLSPRDAEAISEGFARELAKYLRGRTKHQGSPAKRHQ